MITAINAWMDLLMPFVLLPVIDFSSPNILDAQQSLSVNVSMHADWIDVNDGLDTFG